MLYGGPLGTYLSGLSSSSSSSSGNINNYVTTPSNYISSSNYNTPGSSSYSGLTGLRRSSSRYRNPIATTLSSNTSLPSGGSSSSSITTSSNNISNINNTVHSSSTNPYSSYYTPPVRRKYGTPEMDLSSTKSPRYLSRNFGSSSSNNSTTNSSTSYSGLPQYPRKSPTNNRLSSSGSYGGSSIGTSSSWNSELNTAAYKSIDYKRLYEEEKAATDLLRSEIKTAQKELKELEELVKSKSNGKRANDVEQRKMERRISECEQELKSIEKLRAESEKLHAEHRALIRVVSRLNREQ